MTWVLGREPYKIEGNSLISNLTGNFFKKVDTPCNVVRLQIWRDCERPLNEVGMFVVPLPLARPKGSLWGQVSSLVSRSDLLIGLHVPTIHMVSDVLDAQNTRLLQVRFLAGLSL